MTNVIDITARLKKAEDHRSRQLKIDRLRERAEQIQDDGSYLSLNERLDLLIDAYELMNEIWDEGIEAISGNSVSG